MLEPTYFVDERARSYPTVADLFKTFSEEMHSLYVLSLLLTADNDKAEQCFVSAMGECVEGIGVFMERIGASARRAVVKCAIQIIKPVPEHSDGLPLISLKGQARAAENNSFAATLSLGTFERFVFVMSVLERQSDEECAILLECSRRDVLMARVLALKRVTNFFDNTEIEQFA